SRIISQIHYVETVSREDPQLVINQSYDDIEEDQPIDRANDIAEIVLRGYAAKEIAKDRLIRKKVLVGFLDGFDLGRFTFRHGTFPPNNLWIRVTPNPSLNHAQDGVHVTHDPLDDRLKKTIVVFTELTND
ncbi:hypothetical protein ALC62_15303, partial [Cyphomyrmex costatus]